MFIAAYFKVGAISQSRNMGERWERPILFRNPYSQKIQLLP